MSTEERLRSEGLTVPAGYTIVSLADRPDLVEASDRFNGAAWARFMLESPVANGLFGRCFSDWPQFQYVLLDEAGEIAATNNSMPLAWDGTDDDLPGGWEAQVVRNAADFDAGRAANTLGAMQIVVRPGARRSGLAGTMVEAMRATARAEAYRAVIACVRPTWKERYPLIPIERYALWRRDDGLPFDPWIRLHERLGGRIVRAAPESMTMRGSVADWERWTGLALPETGPYVIAGATRPLHVDRERDEGVYHDENVWMVHSVG